MSNKTPITQNTVELQEILATINNLPEAGEGGREPIVEPLSVTENGTYTPSEGVDGFDIVTVNVPQEGDGGSGIIDVTELPTENIDENAVYRLTENIQVEKTEIYLGAGYNTPTVQDYLNNLGVPTVPNIYVVDNLSNMLESDAQTFTQLHFYILKSDGIVYLNVPAYGGIITLGLLGYQAMGYDKGFTEDITAETEDGVYTTLETYKQIVRWFVRDSGEWKEITAYIEVLTPHKFTDIEILSGDITPRISAAAEIVTNEVSEIKEEWFRKKDGKYHNFIKPFLFATNNLLINATIPSCINFVEQQAFFGCSNLTTVTFKGTPFSYGVNESAFNSCDNLTTINVPWSEGEVDNAPWGATNATINYNYTEG